VIFDKVTEGMANYGYNAQAGEFGDLVAMGIIDPMSC
jgi:chaperonin GroEL (HSP60 family)